MKKLSDNWLKLAIYGTLIFTVLLIVLLHLFSPDTFFTVIVNENGEILKTYNFENLVDRIIDCIGALGAFIIGLIALDQSAKSHKLAEQSQKLAEQAHRLTELSQQQEDERNYREASCNIILQNVSSSYFEKKHLHRNHANAPYTNSGTNTPVINYIGLDFSNSSKAFLSSYAIFWGNNLFFAHDFVLCPNETKSGNIILPEELIPSPDVRFDIVFFSCYGQRTYGSFRIYPPVSSKKADSSAENNADKKTFAKYNIGRYQFYGINNPHNVEIPEQQTDLFH